MMSNVLLPIDNMMTSVFLTLARRQPLSSYLHFKKDIGELASSRDFKKQIITAAKIDQ